MSIGITEKEQNIIIDILKEYKDYSFYFYGSRIKGTWEKTSDLDILIKGRQEVPLCIIDDLKQKFDDSNLPYIVNFSDYYLINKDFYKRIEKDLFPYDWKECKVENLGDIKTGKTPKTSIQENYGGDIPFLTPSDDMSVKYVRNTTKKITELGLNEVKNCLLPANSICVSCIGSDLGKVVITTEPTITNQQINSIIVNTDKYDVDFCYYLMVQLGKLLNYHSKTSTAVPIVNKSSFSNYEVLVPPLEIQRKIATVLGAIDDKIELNNSINKNLEQQMDLLYTNMFIDDTNFVELGSVIETTSGGTPSRKNLNFYKNGTINWIKSKELLGTYIIKTEEYITDEAVKKSSAKILPKQSVLVAMYGATVGAYGIISKEMTCNQAICALIQNERYPYPYIFETIKFAKNTLVNMAVGSAQQNISQILIKQLPVHSNLDKIKKYCNIAELLLCKILNIQEENARLTQLRDTLLPKLMNGEIDVDKMEV